MSIAKAFRWYKRQHWFVKYALGMFFLTIAVILTIETGGSVGAILIDLAIGIGFGIGGYLLGSLLTQQALTWEGLGNAVLDSFLFTSAFLFVSSSINAIKYLCRSKPVTTAELANEVTQNSSAVANQTPDNITGYTQHGLEQAIFRDGHGVSPQGILDAVRNPTEVIYDVSRNTYRFSGMNSVTILNQQGKVVSTWARSSKFWRY